MCSTTKAASAAEASLQVAVEDWVAAAAELGIRLAWQGEGEGETGVVADPAWMTGVIAWAACLLLLPRLPRQQLVMVLVLAGIVFSGETKLAKPGQSLPADAPLEVRGRDHPWVSRGGIKLAHAIEHFGLDPAGVTAMDIGSSTGGFTDVLLQQGAEHVFAVDSGTNQLAWKLRQDPRVTVLEQTSARILTPAEIDRPCTWVVCDASFIALSKVLEVPLKLAAPECQLIALIKPQFEVGRGEVGKGGVVRDPALHARVCDEVRGWIEGLGWQVQDIVESPIKGPEGNIEFLISAHRGGD